MFMQPNLFNVQYMHITGHKDCVDVQLAQTPSPHQKKQAESTGCIKKKSRPFEVAVIQMSHSVVLI